MRLADEQHGEQAAFFCLESTSGFLPSVCVGRRILRSSISRWKVRRVVSLRFVTYTGFSLGEIETRSSPGCPCSGELLSFLCSLIALHSSSQHAQSQLSPSSTSTPRSGCDVCLLLLPYRLAPSPSRLLSRTNETMYGAKYPNLYCTRRNRTCGHRSTLCSICLSLVQIS